MMRIVPAILLWCAVALGVAAAEISGIWVGQQEGRNGEMEDVALQFKAAGDSISGKMFGDEFDLPIENVSVQGSQLQFTVTTTNYYSRTKTTFRYTGTLTGTTMELVSERVQTPGSEPSKRPATKGTLKLKRLT